MIYLDNGASSFPKPSSVAKSMVKAVNEYGANPGRSGHTLSVIAENEVYKCRTAIAEMFNSQSQNVIFTANCTHSINLVLKGFLKPNDEVLTTDMEHNAVIRPLYNMKKITSVEVKVDLQDDNITIENFEKAITVKTKLIAITACSNVLGKITPIQEIGALCKKHNIKLLVDAAQLGGVKNIDIEKCNISFLALAAHKSLFGVAGLGVLILKDDYLLETIMQGGTGTNSQSLKMPEYPPERYEAGTIATPAIAALRAGIEFVNKQGIENIFLHENELIKYTFEKLQNLGAVLYSDKIDNSYVGVLPFNMKNATPNDVSTYLDNNGIMVRPGYHCAYPAHLKVKSELMGSVRLGFSAFNTKAQINILIDKLSKFK